MSFEIQNLKWIRGLAPQKIEDLTSMGPRFYRAFQSIQNGVRNIEQQTNSDAVLHPAAPPPIDALHVTAANGVFHASITHNAAIYRGIRYHLEYADNSQFTNPFPISLGESREHRTTLGNLNLYFRAAASYGNSPPSPWTYHGSQSSPTLVSGGGSTGPPLPNQSQGSGTGAAGVGLSGPGVSAYRSATGAPPVRAGNRGTS